MLNSLSLVKFNRICFQIKFLVHVGTCTCVHIYVNTGGHIAVLELVLVYTYVLTGKVGACPSTRDSFIFPHHQNTVKVIVRLNAAERKSFCVKHTIRLGNSARNGSGNVYGMQSAIGHAKTRLNGVGFVKLKICS